MIEVFQTVGAAAGALAVIAGGAWAVGKFFLFARLARIFTVSIRHYEFADAYEQVVLVEATFRNEGRTRTEVTDISWRALHPPDWSQEARQIAVRTTEWQRIGGTPGDSWNPGEAQQAVLVVSWPQTQRALPLQFRFKYVESIDARGILPMVKRTLLRGGVRGRQREIEVWRLLTHPSFDTNGEVNT